MKELFTDNDPIFRYRIWKDFKFESKIVDLKYNIVNSVYNSVRVKNMILPSVKIFLKEGNIFYKSFHRDGMYHRLNAPARTWFNNNGDIKETSYYSYGKLKR